MPAARQNRSKLADTSSQALPTAPIFVEGNTVRVVLILFMALLSFRGISTPSLPAQGEQRCFSYFNIDRDNSGRDILTGRVRRIVLPVLRSSSGAFLKSFCHRKEALIYGGKMGAERRAGEARPGNGA